MKGRSGFSKTARYKKVRFTRRPIFRLGVVSVYGSILGLFLFGFYEFARSEEYFSVKTVHITGTNHLLPADVLRESGLSQADNLFFLDKAAVIKRVTAMPYVRACSVEVSFPESVTLLIEERVPFASLLVNSRSYELDETGVVLREYGPDEMPASPFITYVEDADFIKAGQRLTQPGLQRALEAWTAFSHTAMAEDVAVSEIAAPSEDNVLMFCDELPYEIRWGRGSAREQAARLDVLWLEMDREIGCTEYLDLRFDDELVCK